MEGFQCADDLLPQLEALESVEENVVHIGSSINLRRGRIGPVGKIPYGFSV